MDISRWRKPPVNAEKKQRPRRGAGIDMRFSPSPCRGCINLFGVEIRWLAPPANLRQPSGLERQTQTRATRVLAQVDHSQVLDKAGDPILSDFSLRLCQGHLAGGNQSQKTSGQ